MVVIRLLIVHFALLCLCETLHGAQPFAELLPGPATKGFISIASPADFDAAWDKTQYSQLLDSPHLASFLKQAESRYEQTFKDFETATGFSVKTLWELARGEYVVAMLEYEQKAGGLVVLVDTQGNEEAVQTALASARAGLKERGSQAEEVKVGDCSLHLFRNGEKGALGVHFLHNGILGITQDRQLAEEVVRRITQQDAEQSLAAFPAYQNVIGQCLAHRNSDTPPHALFFVDPVALARISYVPNPQEDGESPEEFARRHGLHSVQGMGGVIDFGGEQGLDLLYRLAVYAPGERTSTLAMFDFAPAKPFTPPAWTPADVSMFVQASWNVPKVLPNFGEMFQDITEGADGTLGRILADIRDPQGPGVDMQKDLFDHLGPDVYAMSDLTASASADSERDLVVIGTKESDNLAASIKRLFRDDVDVKRLNIPGQKHDLWKMEKDCVMIAENRLLIATNIDLIRRILRRSSDFKSLAESEDFQNVARRLDELGAKDAAVRVFIRTEQDLFTTFEMTRQGRIDEAESVYARLLTRVLENEEGSIADIDFSVLPEFEKIRRHFLPVGVYVKTTEKGWFVAGFVLAP